MFHLTGCSTWVDCSFNFLMWKFLWYVILTPTQHSVADSFSALIADTRRVSPLVQKNKSSQTVKADTLCIAYRTKTKEKSSHMQRYQTAEGGKSNDSLNRSRVCRLNWIKIRSMRSIVLNRLFSQNKDTTRQQGSMVIHALTYELQVQDILDNFQ